MFPSVSNFVLSFQLDSFLILLIFFYLILTPVEFQFSMPLRGCCLPKFICSFMMILKEINIPESSELLSFDFSKVQMFYLIKCLSFHEIILYYHILLLLNHVILIYFLFFKLA